MLGFLKKHSKWASVFVLGVALIAVYKTFDSLSAVASVFGFVLKAVRPFIIAFIIAYLLNIPVKNVDRLINERVKLKFCKKHSYAISIAVVYVVAVLLVLVTLSSLLPALFKSMIDMIQHLPQYAEVFFNYINGLDISEKIGLHFNVDVIEASFYKWIGSIDTNTLSKFAQGGFTSVTSGIATIASSTVSVIIAVIASVYMLIDKDRIIAGMKRIIRAMFKSSKVETALDEFA
ncbi:MAG: AI-2E family transporter [Clostridia bacterium]|nr:AI-2E family transporter [Clostridia bacterium]